MKITINRVDGGLILHDHGGMRTGNKDDLAAFATVLTYALMFGR